MTSRTDCPVIAFPRERTRPPGGPSRAARGEVVIFSGVRVERLAEDAARLATLRAGGDA